MASNSITGTVLYSAFSASALHIVQKNGSSSLTKVSTRPGNCTCEEERVVLSFYQSTIISTCNVLALMSCAYSDGSHDTVFAARIYHLLCSVLM